MNESIYYPYTKKEATDIVARYFGITKVAAKKYLEKDSAYRYGKNMQPVGSVIASMEVELNTEAAKSFYED